jgi:predicted RNA-binding Zn ribbon-like protein
MTKGERPKPFQLVAGNPALDFVNTLDDRFNERTQELLVSYAELLRFTVESGLVTSAQARALRNLPASDQERSRVLAQAIELRETLADAAYALLGEAKVPNGKLDTLEAYFKQAGAARKLSVDGDLLTWKWPQKMSLAFPLWTLAQAAADLLSSHRMALMRSCAKETCGWLFLDTSKNHTRRWCDMKLCGNRTKASNYHARAAGRKSTSRETGTPVRSPE